MLPLTKTLHPNDYADLAEELVIVDRHFQSASPQHESRRWEYALALRAYKTWFTLVRPSSVSWTDVGGAGSPFHFMQSEQDDVLRDGRISASSCIIDPEINESLAEYVAGAPSLKSAVFCLSVLEHVDDLDQFLYHLSCLVAPGGLLFLTMDACSCPSHAADTEIADPLDHHHFSWMRRRMFGEADRRWVAERLLDLQFQWFGGRDPVYHGDHVYDYSFASLCLRKRA